MAYHISSGVISTGISLSDDSMHIASGGVANSTTVNSYCSMYISSGGVANNTVLSGGYYSAAVMYVSSGGTANSTTVENGGRMYITSGGTATIVPVDDNATLSVSSGGVASGVTGAFNVQSGAVINGVQYDREFLVNKQFTSGKVYFCCFGNNFLNAEVLSGASVFCETGNSYWENTIIRSGGFMDCEYFYDSSACFNQLTVENGGEFVMNAGATISRGLINGVLTMEVASLLDTTVNSGGIIYLTNRAKGSDITVGNAGNLYIAMTGCAQNITIDGGNVHVATGGRISDVTINSNGKLYLYGGAILDGEINVNGTMILDDDAVNNGNVNLILSESTSTPMISHMSRLLGGTCSVNVDSAEEGDYLLAQDAATFDGTISVGDGSVNYGELSVNGDSLKYNTTSYSLVLSDGNLSLSVVELDIVAPEVEILGIPTKWTNQNVTLRASANEDNCVFQYSLDNSIWRDGNTITLFENQTVYFKVTDLAGNVTEKSVTVDKIDKVAPTLEIRGNATALTNKDVVLSATANEGTIEYYNGKIWIAGTTLSVAENGTYQFRATDAAGNVTEKSVEVTLIDKVAPDSPVASADVTAVTNGNVIVSAAFSSDSVIREYSLNGKDWIAYGKGIVFANNGKVSFRSQDAAGNYSDMVEYTVSNIDKVAPTLEIRGNATEWTNQDVVLTATASDGTIEYFNGTDWVVGSTITASENGTYQFRVTDATGNVTEKSVTVDKIDKVAAQVPEIVNISNAEDEITVDWSDVTDSGSGVAGYYIRYGNSVDLTGDGEFVSGSIANITGVTPGKWFFQVQSIDAVGNRSNWSSVGTFEIAAKPVLTGDKNGVSFTNISGDAKVEFSKDNFASVLQIAPTGNAVDTYGMPAGTYQWQVCADGNCYQGDNIISDNVVTPQKFISDADGNTDVFFANTNGVWENGYAAQHQGCGNWQGTRETVLLDGKNKIADVFTGSTDANVLVLTDDANGDALFVDDIYTALGDQARLSQINEIRAGFGDDIVDLTSQQFAYIGNGVKVYGGAGNDTIWANSGDNTLFGDAGNDRLVGANGNDILIGGAGNDSMHGGGGNDTFCFGANWGNDTIEQLAGGKVTLHFETGSNANWNAETLTYTDGANSVKVSGVTDVTLVFGEPTPVAGAFLDAASEKIFEDKSKGMIA